MFKRIITILVLSLVLFAADLRAQEQTADAYTVKDLTIVLEPGNVDIRRDQATKRAASEGLRRLLQKITPRSDWARHDELMTFIDPQAALKRMDIVEETLDEDAYRLTLDLTYNRDQIRTALTRGQQPFSESNGESMLILPILILPEQTLLWEENNPWKEAMEQAIRLHSGTATQPVVALGDGSDMFKVKLSDVVANNTSAMLELASQYNAKNVLIAIAQEVEMSSGERALRVQSKWVGEDAPTPNYVTINWPQGISFEDALVSAAGQTLASADASWRSGKLVRVDEPGRTFIAITPTNAADVEKLRIKLESINTVRAVKIKLISRKDAVFQVDFFGEVKGFIASLERGGLKVNRDGGLWRVDFGSMASLAE